MAQPANDGTMFTNGMARNRHNRKLAAQGMGKPAEPAPDNQDHAEPAEPIEQNPEAMDCINKLKDMGYTADDVAQAMSDEGQEATEAAPLQLPGVPR